MGKQAPSDQGLDVEAILSPEQVAGLLGVSRCTVYRWIERDRLPAMRIENTLRLRWGDVIEAARWRHRLVKRLR